MYKMTKDERELLVSIIADLAYQVDEAKAAEQTKQVARLIERMGFVQERLDKAEVVAVEELERPHYAELLDAKITLSPVVYQRLCAEIRDIPREIDDLLAAGMDHSAGRILALEHQLKHCIMIQQRCIVVPANILRHR